MAKKYIITNTSEGTYNSTNPIPLRNIEEIGGDKELIEHDHDGDYVKRSGDTMAGDLVPTDDNVYSLGGPTKAWRDIYVGPGSLYVNGKKVIEDVSDTMNFTTSLNQNLAIKTSGVGGLQLSALGSGNVEFNAPNGLIQFKNSVMFQSGSLIRSSDGTPFLFDDSFKFSSGEGIIDDLIVFGKIIRDGGSPSQFLKADGSLDENTFPPLDINNKIPEQYLPESVLGKVEFIDTWNPNTNTPNIGLATESKGHYYIVNTPGTFETIEYNTRDWIISNGTSWEKVDNTEIINDVFGRIGSIVAQEADYQSFYPKLTASYDDPIWITGLDWAKINNKPALINNYVNEVVWNPDNGYLYLNREGMGTVFTTIDGRYSTLDHNHDNRYVNLTGDTMSGPLTVGDNIEMTSGWFITGAGTRTGIGGLPTLSTNPLQVHGGFDMNNGNITFMNNGVANNVLYTGGNEIFILRNFGAEPSTLFEIRSKAGNPTSDIREATLALTRTDDAGNAEFLDLYNNGYHTGFPASVQYGIRIQSRGTGQLRPFVFDWYDGTTYTDGYTANIDTGFKFFKDVELTSDLSVGGAVTSTSFIRTNGQPTEFLKANGDVDNSTYITGINNITEIPNRDYADLGGKPTLNLTDWDTAYGWGNFRDYGLGITTPQGVGIPGGNLNSITIPNGLYKITISTLNSPVGGEAGTVTVERSGLDNYITQKAHIVNAGDISRAYIRHYKPASSTWTPWRRLWTTEDFTITNVGNWNTAYSWGDHAEAGYLTTPPDYTGVYEPVISPKGSAFNKNFGFVGGEVAQGNDYRINNGETAFGWGDHALGGYLTPSTGDVRYVEVNGDTMTGNLLVQKTSDPDIRAKHTTSNSRARVSVENNAGSYINMIITGTSYVVPNFAGFNAHGVDMIFATDGQNSSGGTSEIVFSPGGYDNIGLVITPSHRLGIGAGSLTPTEQLTVDNNVLAKSFIMRNGSPSQFLMADGSIRTSDTVLSEITVTDDNTSITRNQIATVEGTPLFETVGEMLQPTLEGNILNIRFKDGDGLIQKQPVDLSNLAAFNNTVSNATYSASTNRITLTETDGGTYEIDLSEFSILTATDANGITTLKQEVDELGDPILKLTVSKVGQTGEWNDILNKPTTFPATAHDHDDKYVELNGDTMTGELKVDVGGGSNNALYLNGDMRFGPDYAGVRTGLFKYNTIWDGLLIDTWGSGKQVRIGGSKIILGIGEGGQLGNVGVGTTSPLEKLHTIGFSRADGFKTHTGTSTQFLKADGTVDSNTYALSSTLTEHDHDADYVNVTGDTMSGPLTISDSSTPGQTVFDIQGSSGQLFSITDSLEGDLFSVNDISGLPIFNVHSDDRVEVNGELKINSGNATGLVADTVITTLPVVTNEAAFFDYVIKREDGLGLRAGTIMAVWDGTNVEFNDTSTKDLGGITDLIDLSVDILTGEVRLVATITGGTWTVKAGTRVL